MKEDVYIVDAKRTAIGNLNGSLSTIPAHTLSSYLFKDIISRNLLDPSSISEVIMGQVLTAAQGQNPTRQASVTSGIPFEVPAMTVSQVCGSGLRAVALGYQSIINGDSEIVIAGGQENMSLAPHAIHLRSPHKYGDASMIDTMAFDGLTDAFAKYPMGITAENLVKKYSISRQEQDEFAVKSHNKAELAQASGLFTEEIVPIPIKTKEGVVAFVNDEFIRKSVTIDSLAKLRPAFNLNGTVTAGNSSGINDGAAALLLMNESALKKYNLTPLARIVSHAHAGVDPSIMGIGPVYAVKKALHKAGWNINDLDLIESNEAFAAQAISVSKELEWDLQKVNVNGGAVALGHPIGASGARVLVTLIHAMKNRQANKGLATLCVGGGMGVALCVEKA